MGKKSDSTASRLVLQTLKESSRTKKELKRVVKAARPSLKKKYTKRALKDLVASGKVKKDGKEYRLAKKRSETASTSTSTSKSTSTPKSILSSQKQTDQSGMPIGMKLREANAKKEVKFSDEPSPSYAGGDDMDDEIARLEKELMDGMNDSDDSESSSEEDVADEGSNSNDNPAILSLSSFADDRVKSLPTTCLPVPGKYSLTKKRKGKKSNQPPQVKSGLQLAVEEVLGGYTARSSEKIPFYCRFCSKQYEDETTFYEHKDSEFHKTAVALERKATYCKLCRKQFTSPVQMKEHLSSRPHKQRLDTVRSRQQGQQQRQRFR
jgi:hypothetical protein